MPNSQPKFLPIDQLRKIKDPGTLPEGNYDDLSASYCEYEAWEAMNGREDADGARIVAEGLTFEQAQAYLQTVASRAGKHPRFSVAVLERQTAIAWFRDAVLDPKGAVGFAVEIWCATDNGYEWYISDRSIGFGRFPWLWGWGWLPQGTGGRSAT